MNRKKGIEPTESGKKINLKSQNPKIKNELKEMQHEEDTTKYGEFVSSYFNWNALEGQKKRANELENMTSKKNLT